MLKRILILVLFISTPLMAQIYVSSSGSDSAAGTIDAPIRTFYQAVFRAGPDSIVYLRGGTYTEATVEYIRKSGTSGHYINLWAYPGETPVLDFATETSSEGISLKGSYVYLKGIVVMNAFHNGINVSGSYNIIENCTVHDNRNSGFQMGSSSSTANPAHNLILNCDSYRNFDSPIGGNADGYAIKWNIGSGNVFRKCRSWNNSDDGWDLWMADSSVEIDSCISFRNGVDTWHTGSVNGNGNGFKLGGNNVATPHTVKNCVAFDNAGNTGRGFDENNNLAGQTLYNCFSYRNKNPNYAFTNNLTSGHHTFLNCISYQGNVSISSGTQMKNSWQGVTVTDADFLSVDTTGVSGPRDSTGNLPASTLFRLAPGSAMIDAGTYAGMPYNGAAPDLGPYETGAASAPSTVTASAGFHGRIVPEGAVSVPHGGVQQFVITPDSGYVVDSIRVDDSVEDTPVDSTRGYTFSNVTADHAIRVTFKLALGVTDRPTGVPGSFALYQNTPNPFNPTTDVGFRISDRGFVTLEVYDPLGRQVATLVSGEKAPGEYHVTWNASTLSSGVYYCRLSAGNYSAVKKMTLTK